MKLKNSRQHDFKNFVSAIFRACQTEWKKQAIDSLPDIFSKKHKQDQQDNQQLIDRLYMQIGELQVDVNWMKKKSRELGIDCGD